MIYLTVYIKNVVPETGIKGRYTKLHPTDTTGEVITCPCPWYQFQVKHSSYVRADTAVLVINTLRPRWSRCHFADDSFRYIFVNENILIFTKISLKFIAKGPINNIPALVQVMAWRGPGNKPLSEAMMARLLTHICVVRPQWVKLGWLKCVWKMFYFLHYVI